MSGGVLYLYVLLRVFVIVFSTSIDDEIYNLKTQLNTLLQRRQEDYYQLEESLKKSFDQSNTEINNLRNEIKELRSEINELQNKECNSCNGNRMKNEHLTIQWLSNSIAEIRSEVSELAQSFNFTTELQHQQAVLTDILVLQNDVVSLRHDVEMLKGEIAKSSAKFAILSQDVEVSSQLSHNTAVATSNLTEKLQTVAYNWSRIIKKLQKKSKVYKRMVVVNKNPLDMHVLTSSEEHEIRKHRRHTVPLKYVLNLQNDIKTLRSSQKYLKNQLFVIKKQLTANKDTEAHQNQYEIEETKIVKLESRIENLNATMSSFSIQMRGQEKLRSSMLELLESVENIETKLDNMIPDVKREISKLEFNLAKITSVTELLNKDLEDQKTFVKSVSESLSETQEKVLSNENEILNVNLKLQNRSLIQQNKFQNFMNENVITRENNEELSSLDIVLRSIPKTSTQIDSMNIMNRLPQDCSTTSDDISESGLYLVSPDEKTIISVYCDFDKTKNSAYTVIQRRINGIQDFNKTWKEYSVGFGDLTEEFWLGNEAIHHLTKYKDKMARIEFKDISGKFWFAEYDEFQVTSKNDGYRIYVSGYKGNASDSLQYQNGMQFSTADIDRDISNMNCAAKYEGGWWFSHCQHSNLNGRYNSGMTWFDSNRNDWIVVTFSEIKLMKKL